MQTHGRHVQWRAFLLQTCQRIRLADGSLLLKCVPTRSLGHFVPHCPVAFGAMSQEENPCTRGRVGNPLAARSCVSANENEGVRRLGASDDAITKNIPLLSSSDPPKPFARIRNTTLKEEICLAQPVCHISCNDAEQKYAQEVYTEDAATKHRTNQGKCGASGHTRTAAPDLNTEIQQTQMQQHLDSRNVLRQQSSSTRTHSEFYNSVVDCMEDTCAEPSPPRPCFNTRTNVLLLDTNGKDVAGGSPPSTNTACQLRPASHLAGVCCTHRTAAGCTPQSYGRTASDSFPSTNTCQRSTCLGMSRPTNPKDTQHLSLPRKPSHTEVTGSTRERSSAPTASSHHKNSVASSIVYRRDCQGALHMTQEESPDCTSDKRMATEPFSENCRRPRHGIPTTCILTTPSRTSTCERIGRKTRIESSPYVSTCFEENLADATWQTPTRSKTVVERTGCRSGSTCGVIRERVTMQHHEVDQETRRTACSALGPRLCTENSTDEWKTTTATAAEGASQNEELGTCHTPRPALGKLLCEQHVQHGHARHFHAQVQCNRASREAKTEKFYQGSFTGPATAGENVSLIRRPLSPRSTSFLPAW